MRVPAKASFAGRHLFAVAFQVVLPRLGRRSSPMTLRAVHERYRRIGLRDSLALLLMLALALVLGMLIASWGQHKAVLGIIALIALAMLGIFLEPANRPTVGMAKIDSRSGELRGPEVS